MKCSKNVKENNGRLSPDTTNKVLWWDLITKSDINITQNAVRIKDVCTVTSTLSYKFYHPISYAVCFGLVKFLNVYFCICLLLLTWKILYFKTKA